MPDSREDSVYLAKLAEQAERYEGIYRKSLLWAILITVIRNGREYETRRFIGPGADRRGAQPAFSRIQERHRCPPRILENRLFDRAERGVQRQRGSSLDDQGLQGKNRGRACQDLRGHPRRS